MQEIINTLLNIFRAIIRFKWLVLVCALPLALLGWAFVYQLEDKYSATARVFVDTNRILKPLLKGIAVQPDVNQRVNLLSRTLLNRPNLEKLSRMSDLDVEATTDREKELLIDKLSDDIKLASTRGNTSVYRVSYSHGDPLLAKRMVQSLITIFVESAIGDEQKDTKVTQEFLDEQKIHYENRLVEADAKLAEFKRRNSGLMPDDREKNEQKLDGYKTALTEAQQQLAVAESKLEVYQSQLQRQPRSVVQSVQGASSVSTIDNQLDELRRELSTLSSRYTSKYPHISQLRDSIESLEQQKEQIGSNNAANGIRYNRVANPLFEQLQTQFTLAEIEVGALRRQVADNQASVQRLEASLDTMPDVAKELNRLARGNESLLNTYHQILDRRESARLSEQVEQNVDNVTFRVIDPPFVSAKSSGPSKSLLSAGVLIAALAAGVTAALFMAQLLPVFYNPKNIVSKTGRHVLGSVGLRMSLPMRIFKTIDWLFVLLVSGLLLLLFVIIEFHYMGVLSKERVSLLMGSPIGPVINQALTGIMWIVDTGKSKLGL